MFPNAANHDEITAKHAGNGTAVAVLAAWHRGAADMARELVAAEEIFGIIQQAFLLLCKSAEAVRIYLI